MKEITRKKYETVDKLYSFFTKFYMLLFVISSIVCVLSFDFIVCILSFIGSLSFGIGAIIMDYERQNWEKKYIKQFE